jgi:hypothetical protein
VSNYKEPQKQSPTYLQRQSQAWCKVHKERVRSIIKQERLCLDAKLIYTGLLTYFHDGGGVLIESKERVAKSLGFTKERLDYCLEKLDQGGWLEISESGMIFEPVVYKYITGNEHPDDAESSRISQDLAKSGRILHSSPGETSPLDKNRASSLDASNAASKERSDSLSYQNEEYREKGEGSRRVASLFPGLKLKDIEEVRQANLDLDWSSVCSEFVRVNQEKKTPASKVDRKWFERFVVYYRKWKGAATASPGPARKEEDPDAEAVRLAKLPRLERDYDREEKENKDLPEYMHKAFWTLGGKPIEKFGDGMSQAEFIRFIRNMSPRSPEKAHKFLCGLAGKEWNTQDAFETYDNLFGATASRDWCGADYESEQDKAARIERQRKEREEKSKAAEAAAEAQKAEERARQHAEQIRKEREDAERQEREKAAAILKQQLADEAAKRAAAELEEREKEEAAFKEKFASALAIVGEDKKRFRMFQITVNFAQAANIQKERLREDLSKRGFTWEESCGIISAIEGSKLNWWKPEIEEKREKHLAALLNKTVENGCTEGEAASAAEKAQELKAKYGIGLKEMEGAAIS